MGKDAPERICLPRQLPAKLNYFFEEYYRFNNEIFQILELTKTKRIFECLKPCLVTSKTISKTM